MAREFGVGHQTYSNWETKSIPTPDVMARLAHYFNISLDDFIQKKLTPADLPDRSHSHGKVVQEPGATYMKAGDAANEKLLSTIGKMTVEARERASLLEIQESVILQLADLLRRLLVDLEKYDNNDEIGAEVTAALSNIDNLLGK